MSLSARSAIAVMRLTVVIKSEPKSPGSPSAGEKGAFKGSLFYFLLRLLQLVRVMVGTCLVAAAFGGTFGHPSLSILLACNSFRIPHLHKILSAVDPGSRFRLSAKHRSARQRLVATQSSLRLLLRLLQLVRVMVGTCLVATAFRYRLCPFHHECATHTTFIFSLIRTGSAGRLCLNGVFAVRVF